MVILLKVDLFMMYLSHEFVDIYAESRNVDLACQAFERNSQRNVVSWNLMIINYVKNECTYEALELFHQI
jgi:pentatricopeptide repeat protein